MAKKTVHDNYRVEVTLDTWTRHFISSERSHTQMLAFANEVKASIERHVDDIGPVAIMFDTRTVCEFCGRAWETDPADGCPLCCSKAVAEWEAQQAEA